MGCTRPAFEAYETATECSVLTSRALPSCALVTPVLTWAMLLQVFAYEDQVLETIAVGKSTATRDLKHPNLAVLSLGDVRH
eukprot:3869920-Rhodomonas_salina.4